VFKVIFNKFIVWVEFYAKYVLQLLTFCAYQTPDIVKV